MLKSRTIVAALCFFALTSQPQAADQRNRQTCEGTLTLDGDVLSLRNVKENISPYCDSPLGFGEESASMIAMQVTEKCQIGSRCVIDGEFAGRGVFYWTKIISARPALNHPSFSCAAAKYSDELAICKSQNLSNLDLQLAEAFRNARAHKSDVERQALDNAESDWLRARSKCGQDASCIEMLYQKRLLELAQGSLNLNVNQKKISVGDHSGDATILLIKDADTDGAQVQFRRELDDWVEDCSRNAGLNESGALDSKNVADCVKESSRIEGRKIFTRSAKCSIAAVFTEFGNYSMVHMQKENESVYDGKTYKPIRTDWKDARTKEIVGNCSACMTNQLLDTLKVLCPSSYKAHFDGYSPY